ncbi:hypothetical protein AB4510_15500 [Vibrio sp. 10N.222.54.B12]|uniref:hypothetical protein n=1 Tax=unclassified Vibrio TaxID=2614977 RepID=UPI0010BD08CE|nr:hypothetical protein [Vibrio sp. F13]TKG30555.1 hypothetical protein FCV85_12805 [Vibrio sp. F13]
MNRTLWFALISLLFSMTMVFCTYSYGIESHVEITTLTLVLSGPLIFTFALVVIFCGAPVISKYKLLGTIAICVHGFTASLHVLWNGFMFVDVINKQGLGPGQGYSGLILWVGSIKAMLLGLVVGVCLHYLLRLFRKAAVR